MTGSIRILIVETRGAALRLARELLCRYDLDFCWQCVSSVAEARSVEQAYGPSLVLGLDRATAGPAQAFIDGLPPSGHDSRTVLLLSIEDSDTPVNHTRRFVDLLHEAPIDAGSTDHGAGRSLPARALDGIARRLRSALDRNALEVSYQPQYECGSGRGRGFEALARWVLASGENIGPAVFIPVAEAAGMIDELGEWMLQSACGTAVSWRAPLAQTATMSVNVSTLQINERFTGVLMRVLRESGFPANRLELEITESALIADTSFVTGLLMQWQRLGVRIALDDFGAGFSGFNYLARLPLDRLKLDRSLVHSITRNAKSAAVVRSIIALCIELGIDVTAEGVETEEQLGLLTDFGCHQVQGYLLARPMRAQFAQGTLCRAFGDRVGRESRKEFS